MSKELITGIIIIIWGILAWVKPAIVMKLSPIFSFFKPNHGIRIFYRIIGIALPLMYFLGIYAAAHH